MPSWFELVPSLALGIGLAACAGLRAWLPLLLTGLLSRADLLELGQSFQFLGSDRALILFAVATVIEILGDKIPVVDHTLDTLSTVLRPLAGSLLAASVLWKISDPLTAIVLGVAVGAPSALVPHAAKTALRAGSTVMTGGLANPVISVIEDVAAVLVFIVTVLVPLVAVALLALAAAFVLRRIARRREAPPTAVTA